MTSEEESKLLSNFINERKKKSFSWKNQSEIRKFSLVVKIISLFLISVVCTFVFAHLGKDFYAQYLGLESNRYGWYMALFLDGFVNTFLAFALLSAIDFKSKIVLCLLIFLLNGLSTSSLLLDGVGRNRINNEQRHRLGVAIKTLQTEIERLESKIKVLNNKNYISKAYKLDIEKIAKEKQLQAALLSKDYFLGSPNNFPVLNSGLLIFRLVLLLINLFSNSFLARSIREAFSKIEFDEVNEEELSIA